MSLMSFTWLETKVHTTNEETTKMIEYIFCKYTIVYPLKNSAGLQNHEA